MASCPVCGFTPASVSPTDATVALRSYGRRFRRLLEESESPSAVLAAAGAAATAVEAAGRELERVLRTDDPTVAVPEPTGSGGGSGAAERLERAAAEVAEATERVSPDDWRRTGHTADGRPVDVLALVGAAVHAGAHQLRLAQRAAGPAPGAEE